MRAIVVGLGGRGRGWLNDCRNHPTVDVVACVEPSDANRQYALDEFGVPANRLYNDLEAAIDSVDADFVVDVTPPLAHVPIALTSLFCRSTRHRREAHER